MGEFELVGHGLTVYQDDQPIEGPVRWLDSPASVIEFVNSGKAAETIVLSRGGTTTFLTPALTAGVKGIMTLHGAPESHLGILAREYGIPCLMSVAFERGVRSSRGEVIPADGSIVRIDVSGAPQGRVLIEPGAPAAADGDPASEGPTGPSPEELAAIQEMARTYQGQTPHGAEGDRLFRQRLTTDVLLTGNDDRALNRAELNELLAYQGWNFWDCLGARASEGESGLIPRQEYEALGCVQVWQRYPEIIRYITDKIGVAGLVAVGGLSRREVGTKANMLHMWSTGMGLGFGRGITLGLGRVQQHEREADLRDGLQFVRRLYRGLWGGDAEQPMFSSMRDFAAPLLGDDWTARFRDEVTSIVDPDARARYQRFSANTELMGFLLHFDNRCGLHDSGPYPTSDGGFMIVRDHFLSDNLYPWTSFADGLPHAITQAMFFTPDSPLEVALYDTGTIFTKPANYLKYMTGMAVYARDRWDTPAAEIRLLDDAEIDAIQARCTVAADGLYRHIAAMPRRDKIMAGVRVYYTDFIAPFARAAGVWEQLKSEVDFFEWDRVTSDTYYDLVADGRATGMVPRLFLTGAGFSPVVDPVDLDAVLPALHLLALRGVSQELPTDPVELEEAGVVSAGPTGYLLTEAGVSLHLSGLADERETYDRDRLNAVYERFLKLNGPMKALCTRWSDADEAARWELLDKLAEIMRRIEPVLRRTTEQLPRFDSYLPRLQAAADLADQGQHEYLASPKVDSVHTVWMELHEDYLLTQDISREQEGSF